MKRNDFGVWEIFLPDSPTGGKAITHKSKVKISMKLPNGERIERVPAWIRRVEQDASKSVLYECKFMRNRLCYMFVAVFWNPETTYKWKNKSPPKPTDLRVYEAHGKFVSIVASFNR
jgi:1,4-alpha-glucan branching enzyme